MNSVFWKGMAAGALLLASTMTTSAQDVRVFGASATLEAYHGFLFLGNPLGFYEAEGVSVDFGTAAGSAATLQLLASGQVDMGYIGMGVLVLAKQTNPDLPVKAVYLQDRGNIYEIVVPADSDIQSVADLNGRNIGVANLASGAIPSVRGMLSAAGLNPDASVGLIPVGNGAQAAAALRTGRVDALALFRAQHALIETLGIEFRYFTEDAPSAVIAANTRFLEEHPDKAAAVLRGMALSSAFAQRNPEAAVREFWNLYGMPSGLTEEEAMARSRHVLSGTAELWKQYDDDSVRWGDMDEGHWEIIQDFLIEQRQLAERVPMESLFTVDLIDAVNEVDISIALDLADSMQ